MATLLYLRAELKDNASECGSYSTADGMLEAFCSKYGLTVREAKTRLIPFRRDTEMGRLVEAAYADLPWRQASDDVRPVP